MLEICKPYLGHVVGVYTNWTPLEERGVLYPEDVDTSDPEVIERTLLAMAEGVSGRLRAAGLRAGTVSVKIRDTAFRTMTRQRTLDEPTDLFSNPSRGFDTLPRLSYN